MRLKNKTRIFAAYVARIAMTFVALCACAALVDIVANHAAFVLQISAAGFVGAVVFLLAAAVYEVLAP